MLATVGLSLLPDLDTALGVVAGDLARFHSNISHSLIFGLVVALVVGGAVGVKRRRSSGKWFLIALVVYELHVLTDYATLGRGVLLLWPLSSERYVSPIKVFYGLHWSQGWISTSHLVTLITEVRFIVILVLLVHASSFITPTRRYQKSGVEKS